MFFLVLLVTLRDQTSFTVDESDIFPELVYWTALKKGNYDKVSFYLESGFSSSTPDNNGMTPLAYGIKSNNKKIIELLLEYDADIEGIFLNKMTPLLYAAYLNRFELIPFLIENNANVNKQDNLGKTALMIAIEKEFPNTVKQIINTGINPDISDYAGNTIFDYLKFTRNQEIIFLISQTRF